MQYIVTAEEMKFYDGETISKIGIPSLVLMERAAYETAEVISRYVKKGTKVIVFAGTGNNGGDGIAVGRILAGRGAEVAFYMPGDESRASAETGRQLSIIRNLGFSILRNLPKAEYDIVIDSLFGIGLTRDIAGEYAKAVEDINVLRKKGALVVSVDIPSGISADSGKILGCCVEADITVTFEYGKAGHYFYPGREKTGKLFIRSIGISDQALKEKKPSYFSFNKEEMKQFLPARNPAGNKGTFGKVLLLAGSVNMAGAAILCGRSILRAGAGMVKIITPSSNRSIVQKALPEALLYTYGKIPDEKQIETSIGWADVIVAGPGISKDNNARILMKQILKQGKLPMVIDADGLNLIAEDEELKQAVKVYERKKIIMTPHPGEFIRLSEISMEQYKENPRNEVVKLAKKYGCIVAGKDAVTLVSSPDVETVYMNLAGNDGMATAGSGDVLAGVIGGLLAQHAAFFEAACMGVCIHGIAGDRAAAKKSRRGLIASDLVDEICSVLME
ncbi:MAG: NAD(P)H-hydrate dehydratase [Suilimivivens sp.]